MAEYMRFSVFARVLHVNVHEVNPSIAYQLPASELFGTGAIAVAAPG